MARKSYSIFCNLCATAIVLQQKKCAIMNEETCPKVIVKTIRNRGKMSKRSLQNHRKLVQKQRKLRPRSKCAPDPRPNFTQGRVFHSSMMLLRNFGWHFGPHWILKGSKNRSFSQKINIQIGKTMTRSGSWKNINFG